MDVRPTVEQREFAAMLRGLLATENPVSVVRAQAEPGADRSTPTLWKALTDAGVFGLAIAEEHGGSGGSLDDLAVFYNRGRSRAVPDDRAQHRASRAGHRPARLGGHQVRLAAGAGRWRCPRHHRGCGTPAMSR